MRRKEEISGVVEDLKPVKVERERHGGGENQHELRGLGIGSEMTRKPRLSLDAEIFRERERERELLRAV